MNRVWCCSGAFSGEPLSKTLNRGCEVIFCHQGAANLYDIKAGLVVNAQRLNTEEVIHAFVGLGPSLLLSVTCNDNMSLFN